MGTQSPCPVSPPSFSELPHSIGSPSDRPFPSLGDPSTVPTSHIRKIAQDDRIKKQKNVCAQGESYGHATTISMLPEGVLLEIFNFYKENDDPDDPVWDWHLLVHVCRRWRQIVFMSPLRLNLRILCTSGTPVGKDLGIWPDLPISIDFGYYFDVRYARGAYNEDNTIAALEYLDRVRDVTIHATGLQLEKITRAMQEPFPVLISLKLRSKDGSAPVLPAEFLGGSAPCLREINLYRIPFPALPTLLLSTSDLDTLTLLNIPPTGYISPEAMVTVLAALPRLRNFTSKFQSATRPDRIHPPPITRTVLPALAYFLFTGASEYLEDFVARIDAPQLFKIDICYLNQYLDFQVAQLPMFIDRSVGPKLTLTYADVLFQHNKVSFNPQCRPISRRSVTPDARTGILCRGIDWQVSHVAHVLGHFSATYSKVVHLRLWGDPIGDREEDTDVEWIHLFHQFSGVQTMCVSQELAGHVALALEDITAVDAFPNLDLIYLEGQIASTVEKFVAARRLSERPVTVLDTEREFDERVQSYVSK